MQPLTSAERRFVLERLDPEHVLGVAVRVKACLNSGRAVEACYMPGDGTHYALMFAPLGGAVGAPGGGSGGNAPGSYWHGSQMLIVYGQREKAVAFSVADDPEWTAGQLTDSPASVLAIAALLRAVVEA